MKYGTAKTGKIHLFTDVNECLCDLNIQIDKEVSKEYVDTRLNICGNCQSYLDSDSPYKHKDYRSY